MLTSTAPIDGSLDLNVVDPKLIPGSSSVARETPNSPAIAWILAGLNRSPKISHSRGTASCFRAMILTEIPDS